MSETCDNCATQFYKPKTMIERTDFEAMQRVRVGCSKCQTAICFSCAATAADKFGECFCPKCGADLGGKGEAGQLGDHFSGWK